MSLVLDHIFCFCSPNLEEVSVLEAAGFILTKGTKHQGQGTANRSIVFKHNFLELIYLDSLDDALSNPIRLDRRAQWKVTGSSPFGIALRGEVDDRDKSQFWEYRPPYNPSRVIQMHKFNEQRPEFPLLFVMPPSSSANQGATFVDYRPHGSGSTSIKQISIETMFPRWPLHDQVEGLLLREGIQPRMGVQLDGQLPQALQLNGLLGLTASDG